MPTLATKALVLDGRAQVVSYERDPEAIFLRVYVKEKKGYKTTRIEGAQSEPEALAQSLDTFIKFNVPGAVPKRGPKEGQIKRAKKHAIEGYVSSFLVREEEKVKSGLIDKGTLKNKVAGMKNFLLYCEERNLNTTNQIKVGFLDYYEIFRREQSVLTRRKEISIIKEFINYLIRNKCIDPYEAASPDLIPKIRTRDIDFSSNPPIREKDWRRIVREIHLWVKDAEGKNRQNLHYRRQFWTVVMLLKTSGLRPCEALNLTWKDVEIENIGRFSKRRFDKSLGELQAEGATDAELDKLMKMSETKEEKWAMGRVDRYVAHIRVLESKTGSMREVTCNVAERLVEWRKWSKEWAAQYGMSVTNDLKVFCYADRGEWKHSHYNYIARNWRRIIDKLDGQGELVGPILSSRPYNLYSLRSTRAEELMKLGVDLGLAAKQMGHTPRMLLKVYARLPQRERATREAAYIEFGKTKSKNMMVSIDNLDEVNT